MRKRETTVMKDTAHRLRCMKVEAHELLNQSLSLENYLEEFTRCLDERVVANEANKPRSDLLYSYNNEHLMNMANALQTQLDDVEHARVRLRDQISKTDLKPLRDCLH